MKLSLRTKRVFILLSFTLPFFLLGLTASYAHLSAVWYIMISLALFVITLRWGFYHISRLDRPLQNLARGLQDIAEGHLEYPIGIPDGKDGIGELAGSMEILRQKLAKASQPLPEIEQRYRDLIETSKALIVVHDLEGYILSVNKEAAGSLGYQPEELMGKRIPEFMETSVRHLFGSYLQDIRSREKTTGLITLLTREGHKQVWEFHNTLKLDPQKAPIVFSTGFDVTPHIKLEKALKDSEERYRQIVENSTIAISVYQEGRLAFANEAAANLFVYDSESGLKRKFLRNQVLKKGDLKHFKEERYFSNDGKEIIVESTTSPFSYQGKPAILRMSRDVTQQKKAEEALREYEKYFQALFNSIPEGIFVCDSENYRFLVVNDVMVERYGYHREEFLQMDLMQILDEEDIQRWKDTVQTLCHSTPKYTSVFIHKKRDGTKFPVLIYSRKHRLSDREVVVAIAVDHTEKARVEREITLLAKASELFNSSLDMDKVLSSVAKLTSELMGDRCGIYLVGDGEVHLNPVALYSSLGEDIDKRREFIIKSGQSTQFYHSYIDDVAKTGKPVFIEDISTLDEGSQQLLKSLAINSYLAVPIRSKEKILGVLACSASRESSRPGGRDLEIAQQIADRAALALENAQLFKSVDFLIKRKQALFEYASDPIFILDTEGKIIEANAAACHSLGYSMTELIGKDIVQIKSPAYTARIPEVINVIKEKKQAIFEHEHRRKDGSIFPVEISSRLIELPDGIVIQSINRDITNRKKVEEELRTSMRFNKLLMDSLPCVALILRNESREILVANKTALDSGAIPGQTCFATWAKKETPCPWCLAPKAWETGQLQHLEIETQETVWDAYWLPLGDDLYIHYAFDITERKNLEKQLLQSQKMEAIGQLAGGIAHDFNNILTGITGYTTLMRMKISEDHPFSQGLSVIEQSAWRAAELTKQLLGFARGGKYDVREIDLRQVVHNVINIIRETFDRAIAIKTKLAEDIWVFEGDPGQMEQILMNLCLNARDAMPLGGTLLIELTNITLNEYYVRHHLEAAPGDYVLLTVSDTGTGIPSEIQGKIFEPFFTTKEFGKGTGMGLATVYGIIKNHHGYIRVYSETGKGTCFKIYLPAIKKNIPKEAKSVEEIIPLGEETILLVDDEETIRDLGKTFLEDLGYEVILARDGEEACAIFAQKSDGIDLVLLDMIMPRMGGKETYAKLKELREDVRVLLTSGYSINGQVQEILREGIQGFVQKPFNFKQLAHSVRQALKGTELT